MKTMTCNQLGGACDKKFTTETFEEMAEFSRKHGSEMAEITDEKHLKAMEDMNELMKNPQAMSDWMNSRKKEFTDLAED